MELSDRKKKILHVVVDDYITDVEPVSSKKIQERHLQKVSSATIRSELAALEEMGYLGHPHTSAGKIPMPKAYRYYVDKLMEKGKLTHKEVDYIQNQFNAHIAETEFLVKNAAKVISDITNYTGVGVQNIKNDENIQNIKLVPLSKKTILLIVVTETKVLKDSIIKTENDIDELYVDTGAEILRNIFCGKNVCQAVKIGEEIVFKEFNRYRILFENIIEIFREYIDTCGEKVFTEGTSKMLNCPEFCDIEKAKNFLTIIDSKQKLASMLKEGAAKSVELTVKIGSEDEDETKDFSVVSANYSIMGKSIGSAGVIGPLRMDYGKVVSVLECIRSTIDEIIKK